MEFNSRFQLQQLIISSISCFRHGKPSADTARSFEDRSMTEMSIHDQLMMLNRNDNNMDDDEYDYDNEDPSVKEYR
jgi:hypothetical protein